MRSRSKHSCRNVFIKMKSSLLCNLLERYTRMLMRLLSSQADYSLQFLTNQTIIIFHFKTTLCSRRFNCATITDKVMCQSKCGKRNFFFSPSKIASITIQRTTHRPVDCRSLVLRNADLRLRRLPPPLQALCAQKGISRQWMKCDPKRAPAGKGCEGRGHSGFLLRGSLTSEPMRRM